MVFTPKHILKLELYFYLHPVHFIGNDSVQGNRKALIDYSFFSNSFDIPQMENSPGDVIYEDS